MTLRRRPDHHRRAAATPHGLGRRLEGSPAEKILEVARTHEAELIVIGSRGRGGVTGALLGSVSSDVVHRSDRPVLVARPSARVRTLTLSATA